ncbi:MAG: hypothetical protein EP348_09150, partial [Alphaproteobacteria bacterium]
MRITAKYNPDIGLFDAEITPKNNLLESYFETEIQQDTIFLEELRARIASGAEVDISGNAHLLEVKGGTLRL